MTRPLRILFLSLFSFGAVQQTAAQESLSGQASVIDGDTIEIHGTRIRLRRVDAPEAAQLCEDQQGKSWRCGQQAALALDQFIGRRVVHCNELGKDKYRRTLKSCRVGRTDLGAWLVSEGWAIGRVCTVRRKTKPKPTSAEFGLDVSSAPPNGARTAKNGPERRDISAQ